MSRRIELLSHEELEVVESIVAPYSVNTYGKYFECFPLLKVQNAPSSYFYYALCSFLVKLPISIGIVKEKLRVRQKEGVGFRQVGAK